MKSKLKYLSVIMGHLARQLNKQNLLCWQSLISLPCEVGVSKQSPFNQIVNFLIVQNIKMHNEYPVTQ